jgi:hypothetical protein
LTAIDIIPVGTITVDVAVDDSVMVVDIIADQQQPAAVDVITGEMGPPGPPGPQGNQGVTGPPGPASTVPGPQGVPGPMGPQGVKGDTGATGPQGASGTTGATGPQGPKGDTGSTGATGPAGAPGATGATGATGAAGPQGSAGADSTVPGPPGPAGPQGIQGNPGTTGAQGPQGAQGAQGPAGNTGAAGPTGPTGPKGDTGSTGATGPQGPAGADSTVPGPQGPQGSQGLPGATGAQGPKGDTGATGAQGPTGSTGPAGAPQTPSDINPLVNAAAAPGVSALYSRGDHVHPTDTSRAALTQVVRYDAPQGLTANQMAQARSNTGTPNANLLINGDFRINQGGYASAAVLAAAAYGHDQWKAGAAGGDYSFTQLVSSTQITIAAGKSLIQPIEDIRVVGGSYILTWTGTAQARAGVNTLTPSGAYAASPLLISGQTAGTVMSVEFNSGTLGTVKLESGLVSTPFMVPDYAGELALCQRYWQSTFPIGTPPASNISGINSLIATVVTSTINCCIIRWDFALKRVTPTITTYNPFAAGAGFSVGGTGNFTATQFSISAATIGLRDGTGGMSPGGTMSIHIKADARL